MFLALREILHSKFRYVLIGFIIILIAALIFIISGLAKGLSMDNASSIIDMEADQLVIEEGVEKKLTESNMSLSVQEEIAETKGVEATALLAIHRAAATINGSDQQVDVTLFTTDIDGMLVPSAVEGSIPKKPHEVIVDDQLKKEGVSIGDSLTFTGQKTEYTVSGFAENQRFSHTSVVYMNNQVDKVNAIAIQTDGNVEKELGQEYEVLSKEEVLQGIPSYSQEQLSLNMMIIFLFVISAFVLAVFFYVITLQKKSQFGVLKALGAKTTYLVRNLVGQVVIISIICIGIAIGLTYGLSVLMPADMPFVLNTSSMLKTAALLLVVSLIGSLVSLIQVVKVDPIEAIEGAE